MSTVDHFELSTQLSEKQKQQMALNNTQAQQLKQIALNKSVDHGLLLMEDSSAFDNLSEQEMLARTKSNLCLLYKELFDLKRQQKEQQIGGEDAEILEFTKSKFSLRLPEAITVLPREKPIPKPKPLTKWEKFRLEKGLPPKAKRSRLVYDEITKEWVPRWGKGSIKQIQKKHQWLMEDKPKHEEAGVDPFTYEANLKTAEKQKQQLRQLKNQVYAAKEAKGIKSNKNISEVKGNDEKQTSVDFDTK